MSKRIFTLAAAVLVSTMAFAQTAQPTTPATTNPATTTPALPKTTTPNTTKATMPKATAPRPTAPVNVNTASATQLTSLPGVSSKIAADIIKNRPYKNVAELVKKVKGIGKTNVKPMLPYLQF